MERAAAPRPRTCDPLADATFHLLLPYALLYWGQGIECHHPLAHALTHALPWNSTAALGRVACVGRNKGYLPATNTEPSRERGLDCASVAVALEQKLAGAPYTPSSS